VGAPSAFLAAWRNRRASRPRAQRHPLARGSTLPGVQHTHPHFFNTLPSPNHQSDQRRRVLLTPTQNLTHVQRSRTRTNTWDTTQCAQAANRCASGNRSRIYSLSALPTGQCLATTGMRNEHPFCQSRRGSPSSLRLTRARRLRTPTCHPQRTTNHALPSFPIKLPATCQSLSAQLPNALPTFHTTSRPTCLRRSPFPRGLHSPKSDRATPAQATCSQSNVDQGGAEPMKSRNNKIAK